VQVAVELLFGSFHHFRVPVPDDTDADAGDEVEVCFAGTVVQPGSFRPFDFEEERDVARLGDVPEKKLPEVGHDISFKKNAKIEDGSLCSRVLIKRMLNDYSLSAEGFAIISAESKSSVVLWGIFQRGNFLQVCKFPVNAKFQKQSFLKSS
jgi:hypothetical protein